MEKKPRKDGREHVDRAGGSVELPDALELTLERAKLRCGSMGGGVDPPVDTEKEEADIVSDVTLPRAAAVPGFLRRPDDVLERPAEPQRRLRRRLPRRRLLQRGVPRVRGLHQLPGAGHGRQGLLRRGRVQLQCAAAPEPAPRPARRPIRPLTPPAPPPRLAQS